jgi:hypothetical protein
MLNLTHLKYRLIFTQLDTRNTPADVEPVDILTAPLDADCTLLELQSEMYPVDYSLGFARTTIQN